MQFSEELNKKLSQLFSKWLVVDSNRKLYGPGMPQVQFAMDNLIKALESILSEAPEFSIVTKKGDIEVVGEGWNVQASTLRAKSVVGDIKKIFDSLNINSITFKRGLAAEELEGLFEGMAMSPGELAKREGLKGYLDGKKVSHIQVDQFSFKLLKEGEAVGGAGAEGPGADIKEPGDKGGLKGKDVGVAKLSGKELSSLWDKYFKGKLSKWDLVGSSSEALEQTKGDPKELIKALKRVAKKQKKIEGFLADLEGKLTDLGFSAEVKKDIEEAVKKELHKPKKVSIAEDELARLRQLAKDHQKGLEERVDGMVAATKKLNKKLTDEKERIDTILRRGSDGVIVVDKEGKVLSLNNSAEKALGVSLKEGQKKQIKDIVKSGKVFSMTSDWQKETEEFTPKQVKVISGDKRQQDIIAESSAVIENEDGKAIGLVSSWPCETEMKELDRRKNEILDVLGHDLRAPICAAKQSLAVLTITQEFLDSLDPQQKELFLIFKRNVEKMEKLVNAIMDARQLETGKISLRKVNTDLSRLITDSADSLKVWAESKKLHLTIDIEALGESAVDPERIYQVITNLITNALKFTPEDGRVNVEAKLIKEKDQGQSARVTVVDSGIGIKKEDLVRIFKKYEQVSLKSPKGGSGLGLGLAICQTIVDLHGGKIWAESEEGKGSSFIFTLPIVQEEE